MKHEALLKIALANANSPGPTTGAGAWQGVWKNQMGSTMDIMLNGTKLSGSYVSKTSAIGGGSVKSDDLTGFVAGDLIAITVLWPGGSMTSWVGQMVNDVAAPTLKTLWHLVTNVPDADEPTKLWQSTFAGADDFTR